MHVQGDMVFKWLSLSPCCGRYHQTKGPWGGVSANTMWSIPQSPAGQSVGYERVCYSVSQQENKNNVQNITGLFIERKKKN